MNDDSPAGPPAARRPERREALRATARGCGAFSRRPSSPPPRRDLHKRVKKPEPPGLGQAAIDHHEPALPVMGLPRERCPEPSRRAALVHGVAVAGVGSGSSRRRRWRRARPSRGGFQHEGGKLRHGQAARLQQCSSKGFTVSPSKGLQDASEGSNKAPAKGFGQVIQQGSSQAPARLRPGPLAAFGLAFQPFGSRYAIHHSRPCSGRPAHGPVPTRAPTARRHPAAPDMRVACAGLAFRCTSCTEDRTESLIGPRRPGRTPG